MKENKFIKFITSKYLILTVQLIATAIFIYFIFKLDLVPIKYLAPVTIVPCLLIIIFFFIMSTVFSVPGCLHIALRTHFPSCHIKEPGPFLRKPYPVPWSRSHRSRLNQCWY